jgi:hypothetical protein
VRDTNITLFDVTAQIPDITSGRATQYALGRQGRKDAFVDIAYPHLTDRVLTGDLFAKNPTSDTYAYFLYLATSTGRFRQIIQLVNVNGTWQQAYVVDRMQADGTAERVIRYFDDGYPSTGQMLFKR